MPLMCVCELCLPWLTQMGREGEKREEEEEEEEVVVVGGECDRLAWSQRGEARGRDEGK